MDTNSSQKVHYLVFWAATYTNVSSKISKTFSNDAFKFSQGLWRLWELRNYIEELDWIMNSKYEDQLGAVVIRKRLQIERIFA